MRAPLQRIVLARFVVVSGNAERSEVLREDEAEEAGCHRVPAHVALTGRTIPCMIACGLLLGTVCTATCT